MTFRVSGKNLDIGDALRERISGRIADAMAKHFHGTYSGHATVARDGFGFRTEFAVHLASGVTLEADAMAADAYASADTAAARLEKRLRRYHRRLKDRHGGRSSTGAQPDEGIAVSANTYVLTAPEGEEEEVGDFTPVVVAESTTVLRLMPVSEAVLDLDLTGAPVIVFRNAAHGRVNIVYRRPDSHVGWIDPPPVPADVKH